MHLLGTIQQAEGRSARSAEFVVDDLRAAFEDHTESTLNQLYSVVADALAAEFTDLRERAHAQVEVLAKLAGLDDIAVPSEVDAEMHRIASRVAWQPVGEAAALELLDTANSLAQPFYEAQPIVKEVWVSSCLERSRAEIAEDTGLEGAEIDLAVDRAATAILEWPELESHMPIFFRGVVLTVAPAANGAVFAEGLPVVLVEGSIGSPEEKPDPLSAIFTEFQPDEGVAVFSSNPAIAVALIATSDRSGLIETGGGEGPALVIEAGGSKLPVVLPLAEHVEESTPSFRASEQSPPDRIDLEGTLIWNPNIVEVRALGPAVLLKPKIGDHRLELESFEGLRGRVRIAKD